MLVGALYNIIDQIFIGNSSIGTIGINHNREQGEGALKIVFYNKESMEQAWAQLKKYNYELIPKH